MDNPNFKILMIDDDEPAYMMLRDGLSNHGFTVLWEDSHEKDIVIGRITKDKPDVIVLDIWFKGKNEGKSLLQEIKKSRHKDKPVIMLTNTMKDYRDEDYPGSAFPFAKDVFRLGDRAFADLASQIRNIFDREDFISPDDKRFGFIVGNTPAMIQACRTILNVAPTDATLLITGETGTGKEMVARAIKELSARKGKPFIAVNCAALPDENMLLSDLFGHEKGSFTGATTSKKGIFEAASDGTVFLDEIGDAPAQVQEKLLRAIQEKEISRLGAPAIPITVNVRVICSTNKNLEDEVNTGRFRKDLYYRITVEKIHLPPLRERYKEDFEQLYSFFVRKFSERHNKVIADVVNSDLLESFGKYNWSGNIREFENKIERAIINVKGNVLLPKDFQFNDMQDASANTFGNVEEIANKFWERKIKLSDFADHTKHKGLKAVVIKLIERWIRDNKRCPKRKELADCMGTTDEIMGQVLNKCKLKLTDFTKEKKLQ